jgi:hypothetical protein
LKFTVIQLCINIDQDYIEDLFEDFKEFIDTFTNEENTVLLIDILDILRQFLEKMTVDVIYGAKSLIIKTLDLIAYKGPKSQELYEKLGDFLGVALNISNEENCGELMRDVFDSLKSIVTEVKFYKGIENKKTINALVNLITHVLKVCNDEVSIMAIKCLKFLVSTLDYSYFEEQKNQIYGVILRALCYK